MASIFLGAYWGARPEEREVVAGKVSKLMCGMSIISPVFARWFKLGVSRKKANSEIDLSELSILQLLNTNKRDTDKTPIVELGFDFHAWNGGSSSVAIRAGVFSSLVSNGFVLKVSESLSEPQWRSLCELAVSTLDPDELVVTSHDYIERHGGGTPTEAGGWFTYRRGGDLTRHEFDFSF